MADTATEVVVSYPADLSKRGRDIIEDTPFRAYLRKAHETVTQGDQWEEFVGVGCCGNALDVPLRVESVDGSPTIDEDTAFQFTTREACDLDDGWEVQSAAGPEA